MANTFYINSVDKTSYIKRPSTIIEKRADNKASAWFDMSITAAQLGSNDGLIVGQDVKIYEDATLLFGGVIKKIKIRRDEPGLGSDKLLTVSVTCNDYNDIPSRRVTSSTFPVAPATTVTAKTIVEAMVDDVLGLTGYDDGVGKGTINTGATFNSYSVNAKTVKDVLDDMAEASGFKWYIDDSKDLYFVQEDTITAASHDLVESGATFTDFYVQNLEINIVNYVNKQWVLGTLDDTGAQVNVSAEDATEISNRATIEGGSGVYGGIINATDSQDTADAEDIADNALKVYGKVPYYITFTSYTNDWIAGTKLKCNLPTVGISTDTYFLIESVILEDMGTTFMSEVTGTRRDNTSFSTQRSETFEDYFAKLINKNNTGNLSFTTDTGVLVFVQTTEPVDAPEGSLWINPDDFSRYDKATYTATATHDVEDGEFVTCDGTFTLTLPEIANLTVDEGVMVIVKNIGTGTITVSRAGSTELIDGASTYSLSTQYQTVRLVSDGTDWMVV